MINFKAVSKEKLFLTVLLLVLTIFSLILVYFRIRYSGHYTYLFFSWNLFLALIPYGISFWVTHLAHSIKNKLFLGLLLVIWLLFLPNSFYIITDLFHLKPRHNIPLWYDLLIIFSCAWTGMMIGFISLLDLHLRIEQVKNGKLAWSFSILVLFLCSLGVYLGRYLRWNSWDILSNPDLLLGDITDLLFDPVANAKTYAFMLGYTLFFILGFMMLKLLMNQRLGGMTLQRG